MESDNKTITILIVDDSDIIRYSLKNFFSDYDIEVITCNDGLEGIQKVIEKKPKLIFLDLMMPNFDGVKMLQVIKVMDEHKSIPVIIISGNTNRSNVLSAIEAGADRVISKPLKKDVLIKNISELLGENFLKGLKKKKMFSENEENGIKRQLCSMFLRSFPGKKEIILKGLRNMDQNAIRSTAHEIKGAGGAIGYPKLSVLGGVIEEQASVTKVNWQQIKLLCDQLFTFVEEIEEQISFIEK